MFPGLRSGLVYSRGGGAGPLLDGEGRVEFAGFAGPVVLDGFRADDEDGRLDVWVQCDGADADVDGEWGDDDVFV